MGGLESCHPSAPGIGSKSGPIWKRVCLSWPHQPAKRGSVGCARVPLVDEAAAERARARVQVLVRAPHGEVRPVVVERQTQVAGAVRQVEAHDGSPRVRGAVMAAMSNAWPVR